jgi:hypothetical protein
LSQAISSARSSDCVDAARVDRAQRERLEVEELAEPRLRAWWRHVEHQVLDAHAPLAGAVQPGSIEVIMPGSIAIVGSGIALLMLCGPSCTFRK